MPFLFNLIIEAMMRLALWNNPLEKVGVNVYGEIINNLRFADDINLIADTEDTATHYCCINNSSQISGLKINPQK